VYAKYRLHRRRQLMMIM